MGVRISNDLLVRYKIASVTGSFCALAATGYRLYKRRRKVWADDVWALFAAVALIVQVVAELLRIPPPNRLSQATRIAVFYLRGITFYLIVWASRLSVLFSIVRIESSTTRRKALFCAAAMFIVAALLLVAQLFWVCESRAHSSWKSLPDPQCDLAPQTAIFQLIADATSDAILLFAPWPLFRSLVDKSLGRKLMIIFSVCVVTTIVSLVRACFILKNYTIGMPFSGVVEGCVGLLVANVPVIVTTTIDVVGHPEPGETAEFSSIFWPGTKGTMQLQTLRQ
ncbi:hypothetical protein C8R45DRAFT_1011932 [Mycena sanguinolenta]|nr:hypothetical protein C8R45DRAFT_1011932 [Mycena sanguinolenta]